jgi:uncharacterized protein YcgL (UPF0745 family)
MKCVIFRCSKKDEMYLYVRHQDDQAKLLAGLPDSLQHMTGRLEKVMELDLIPGRKLARANVQDVISAIEQKGFYLQMPPADLLSRDDSMLHDPSDSF